MKDETMAEMLYGSDEGYGDLLEKIANQELPIFDDSEDDLRR